MDTKDPQEEVKVTRLAIDKLTAMMKCKVCNMRRKDIVLAKCYHMFCRECITKNLHMRQRLCPTCRHKFTGDDIKPLWWDS